MSLYFFKFHLIFLHFAQKRKSFSVNFYIISSFEIQIVQLSTTN